MKERVLITGSSGLIGTATARRLAPSFDVIGLDTKPPKRLEPMLEHVHVDLTNDDSVQTAVRHVRSVYGESLAGVIHLAAYYDFAGAPSPLYEEVTVRGTERLVRALQDDFAVDRFIFSSTLLVHAPCKLGEHIDEDWPVEAKWDYPKSKIDTEALLLDPKNRMPTTILRIAGVYDDRCHSIPIANQIQRIFERRILGHVYPGNTDNGQAFVHLDDVAEALALAVERRADESAAQILLIAEPETLSYEELQQALGQLLHGETWETRRIPKALAKAGAWVQDTLPVGEEPFIKPWMIDLADDHYAVDIRRANAVLGWQPKKSLSGTLPRIVDALKADPIAFYRDNKLEMPAWLQKQIHERQRERDAQPHARERHA